MFQVGLPLPPQQYLYWRGGGYGIKLWHQNSKSQASMPNIRLSVDILDIRTVLRYLRTLTIEFILKSSAIWCDLYVGLGRIDYI